MVKKLIPLILALAVICLSFSTASAREDWNFVIETCRKGAKTFGVTCKTVDPQLRKQYQVASMLEGFPDEYMAFTTGNDTSEGSGVVIHTNGGTYEIYFSESLMGVFFVWGIADSLQQNNYDPYEYDLIVAMDGAKKAMTLGTYCEVIAPIFEGM